MIAELVAGAAIVLAVYGLAYSARFWWPNHTPEHDNQHRRC